MKGNGADAQGFDRYSWATLALALALFGAALGVVAASARMPADGWLADRGAFGRYGDLVYFDRFVGESDLRPDDVLLRVEGTPVEQLEAQAAVLNPQRPPNWQAGKVVRYTVLREGRELDLPVRLGPPPLLGPYRPQILFTSPILLTFPLFLAIGVLVFTLRPRERAAQLLFLFGAAFFTDNFLTWMATPPSVADLFSRATYWPKIILGNLLWAYAINPLLVHLFLVFPVEKRLVRILPGAIPLLYAACSAASLLYVGLNVSGRYVSGVAFILALTAPCLLLVMASLAHSLLTVREPAARMQVRWVALGGVVGLVGPIGLWGVVGGMTASSPAWQGVIYLLLALALPASLAIAILRYRLWDIDVILNRALIYGALTGALAVVYFASVVLLQQVFPAESQVAVVLSTLAIAALFAPLRRRIQDGIDRRFYRRKYDAAQVLDRFADELREQVDVDRLAGSLTKAVDEALQPDAVSLWLRKPDKEGL